MSNPIEELATNPKIVGSAGVVTTTYGITFESILNVIPDNIAKLVAVIGIFLTGTMIFYHLRKDRREELAAEAQRAAEERQRIKDDLQNEKLIAELEMYRKRRRDDIQ